MAKKTWLRRTIGLLATAALSLGVAGCGALNSTTAPHHQAASTSSKAPILIGGTLSLTGAFADPSAQYKMVDEYWANQINKHGGLLGRPVKLIILNDESNPSTSASEYETLINQDHVNLLLAPYTTYVGSPDVPIILSHHMLMFNAGFVGEQLFDQAKGWMVSFYTYQDIQYTQNFFKWMHSLPASKRPKTIAVLTDQNPFTIADLQGYDGQGGLLRYAKQYGFKIVLNEQYPAGTTNFDSLIEQAKLKGAQALVALTLPNSGFLIAKTVYQLHYHPMVEFFGGSEVTTLPNWSSLGAAANGTMSTTVAAPNQHFNGLAQIVALFKAHGVKVLPSYAASAYAALQVIQQAVTATHSLNQEVLYKYVHSHTFNTAVGRIHFAPNGTLPNTSLVLQYLHGTNVVVWPKQYATGSAVVPMP
ncbi:MAG: ABC transporter substrate-binding protein [Firmicutes bacterium]|nr:ABC transporter substrate-binding protein [Bacillota bacterium]